MLSFQLSSHFLVPVGQTLIFKRKLQQVDRLSALGYIKYKHYNYMVKKSIIYMDWIYLIGIVSLLLSIIHAFIINQIHWRSSSTKHARSQRIVHRRSSFINNILVSGSKEHVDWKDTLTKHRRSAEDNRNKCKYLFRINRCFHRYQESTQNKRI